MFSPMGSFMTELYPTVVRGVGQGLLLQRRPRHRRAVPACWWASAATRLWLGMAIAVFSLIAYGIMIIAAAASAGDEGPFIAQPGAAGRGVGDDYTAHLIFPCAVSSAYSAMRWRLVASGCSAAGCCLP